MKLAKLLVSMLAVNQCDAVPDVLTVTKIATDLVAGKTGEAALEKIAAAAANPVVVGIAATAWTVSTVADSYFENQTKQAEAQAKQAEAQAKQAEAQANQLYLLYLMNMNMNGFEYERISNMDGFRHTVK